MKNKKVLITTQAAAIAAIYIVLTYLANAFGLANYAVQVRFSEALTILPYFTPVAIPGLFIGCLLSNLLTGCMPLDVIFGSLATLIGAIGTYLLRRLSDRLQTNRSTDTVNAKQKSGHTVTTLIKLLTPLPPIIANTLIIPHILSYVYHFEGSIPYFMLTVGIGEIISCGLLGLILLFSIQKYEHIIFSKS